MSKTRLAIITILSGPGDKPVDPGYGQPGGEKPDQGLPGTGRPPRPDQGLPGGGERPDNSLPGGGSGGRPEQPIYFPPEVWPPQGSEKPDNTLPDSELPPVGPVHLPVFPPVGPDNSLPGGSGGGRPDNSLPKPDQKFELKYTVRYGWVLVPCKDETAQPKKR